MDYWIPFARRSLSPRQRQVAQLRADGHTLAQIADRLGISVGSVEQASAHATRRLRPLSEPERIREIWPDGQQQNAPAAKR